VASAICVLSLTHGSRRRSALSLSMRILRHVHCCRATLLVKVRVIRTGLRMTLSSARRKPSPALSWNEEYSPEAVQAESNSSLRKNLVYTQYTVGILHAGADVNRASGCSKRTSSKAAASEGARRTLRYVEPLNDARTLLADFFSILNRGVNDHGRAGSISARRPEEGRRWKKEAEV
jgi:hypothetical protein